MSGSGYSNSIWNKVLVFPWETPWQGKRNSLLQRHSSPTNGKLSSSSKYVVNPILQDLVQYPSCISYALVTLPQLVFKLFLEKKIKCKSLVQVYWSLVRFSFAHFRCKLGPFCEAFCTLGWKKKHQDSFIRKGLFWCGSVPLSHSSASLVPVLPLW